MFKRGDPMAITHRKYNSSEDYEKISRFLVDCNSYYGTRFDDNLTLFEFQAALASGLESPPKSVDDMLQRVILWFDGDQLVGLLEEGAFCFDPEYRFLFKEAIRIRKDINPDHEWEVYEGDEDFEAALEQSGYQKTGEYWVRRDLNLKDDIVEANLPHGFFCKSVPDSKEHGEVYQAYKLCYGIPFNEVILKNFYETSTYRKELDLVAVDGNNHVAALCSGRYDEESKLLTIEAVSCYPDFRNRGISKALLREQLMAAKELGANRATVYTGMPEKFPAPNQLYESAGFDMVGKRFVWKQQTSKL
ncbi:GNAT family N-acetyltransferase [Bacillus salacetis]|uniref:GNAT family N-acetyltransferase n=1 Tax=Bacillus salacetis TaxID=2315464 RepID=A0A3A1QSQ3_9BACI|nr:GNAT family N-acetyltransferase [Bacillus salacetis]RIW30406.1 GNAT family N-acetyltransferase [Bacillus salacetis]